MSDRIQEMAGKEKARESKKIKAMGVLEKALNMSGEAAPNSDIEETRDN